MFLTQSDIVSTSTELESLPMDLPGEFELTSQETNSLSFPDGEGGSWCPQNALALPNPVPSQLGVEISGSQNSPMYPPNSYLGPSNSDIPCRSEPDQLFSDIHTPRQDSESNILPKESNVALSQQPVFPWDRPQDEQANISITGGTFIGGNVNYIQREVALRITLDELANIFTQEPNCHRCASDEWIHRRGSAPEVSISIPSFGSTLLSTNNAVLGTQFTSTSESILNDLSLALALAETAVNVPQVAPSIGLAVSLLPKIRKSFHVCSNSCSRFTICANILPSN